MVGTILVIAVLVVIAAISVVAFKKHMNGESSCCGGGGNVVEKAEEKKLENPVLGKKIIHIEGMHCENCKNSIERQVNRIEGASCKVDLKQNLAEICYDREISDTVLRLTIERLDFKVLSIEEVEA